MTFRIKVLKGKDVFPYISYLVEMRLKSYCSFPYLYVSTPEEERDYAEAYASNPQVLFMIGFKDDKLAGILTGVPFTGFLYDWRKSFKYLNINPETCFYLGEIMVEPAFQRLGLCSQLMPAFFKEARSIGFSYTTAISSARSLSHPLCPQDYFDIGYILKEHGFTNTGIIYVVPWVTRQPDGSAKEEKNHVNCWIKDLHK